MNLKKFVCPFLCLSVLFGCGTSISIADHPDTHQEIGTPIHELQYEDHYIVNITYPKLNMEAIDTRIHTEIDRIKERYLTKIKGYEEERRAELNVDFQSYVVNERYISIKLDIFESLQENKESILTFVYDKEQESFVGFDDIFDEGAIDVVAKDTIRYFKQTYPNECEHRDFSIFSAPASKNYETFVLRKDKIVFYFQEGTLFDTSKSFEMEYTKLSKYSDIEEEVTNVFVPYDDILNEPIKKIDPNQAMVALTFDDGPTPKYTNAILDALKDHQASATFFVLGNRANNFPEVLQRMVLEGNEVGNHTYSHKQLTALSQARVEEEITHTQESIHDVINRYPNVIRPPYGSKNDTVIKCAEGKKIVTWTIDTQDWRIRDPKVIVDKVLQEVEDGSIILMHDLYPSSAQAAILLITRLQEMGYQLVTVSQLHAYGKAPVNKIF